MGLDAVVKYIPENKQPVFIKQLLEKYKHPKEIWKCKKEDLLKVEGIGEKIAEEILNNKYRIGLKEEIRKMKKEKIELISIYDECYPKNLQELYDNTIKQVGSINGKKGMLFTSKRNDGIFRKARIRKSSKY